MIKKTLLPFLLLLVFPWASQAVEGAFRHYTTRDGLSSNTVQALIQDRAGLIWMGTASGLDSFDGREFIHHAFPAGEDDYVRQLYQDASGLLWIGTENAVFRYDMTSLPERVPEIPEALVTGFAEDRDGALWIAVWEKGVFRYADGVFTQFLEGHQVEGLLVDRDGRLWAADQSEPVGLSLYNAASRTFSAPNLVFQDCRPTRICALDVDEEGDLWLGTWDLGIYRLETDTRTVYPAVPPGAGLEHVHFLTHESPLHLLVGSDDGLLSINPLTGERIHYRNDRSDPASLSSKFVYPIVRDHEGGLWIGTYYGGVNYLPPTAGQFSSVSLSDLVKGNEDFFVSCLCEDPDGTVWIGSDNGGLFRYDPVRKTAVRLPGKLSTLNVHALLRQGEYLWIGSYSQDLFRLHVRTGALKQYGADEGLGFSSVYALFVDRAGDLWAGTQNGAYRFDPSIGRFVREWETNAWIGGVTEDDAGSLWFSTAQNGLLQRAPDGSWEEWPARPGGLPANQVHCLLPTPNGLYAGTKKGLVLLHDGEISLLVPDLDVRYIFQDRNTLWFATPSTIVHYYPEGGRQEQFGVNDGIRGGEFSPTAGLITQDGIFYLGTTEGFVSFYPGHIRENDIPPPVLFTRFLASSQEGTENVFLTQGKEDITLSWRHRDLRISFAALSYSAPEKIRYAYRLEELDEDWKGLGNQNYVALNRLPAGRYTLQVTATSNSGLWNDDGAALSFTIRPHPLLSNVALVLYILFIAALFNLAGRWWLKREERKAQARYKEQLGAAVTLVKEEERDDRIRFLSALSDQLDAPVSGIGLQLERLKEHPRGEAKGDLSIIEKNHRMLRTIATNLRQQRDALSGGKGTEEKEVASDRQEDFLLRLDKLITDNIANPDLSVEFLAREMAISRSGLFAKTKELSGETPNKLINQARLNLAAKLLTEGRHSVGEICYMAGFSSPSYFSKSFFAQYGVTPHDWTQMNKE
ncbi:MAG: helix-turn-helix domain-containing protein [Bacteroidales bacterium]|nr:helix-turn-helix domain-containing protein [Bacteroidales bacterium]